VGTFLGESVIYSFVIQGRWLEASICLVMDSDVLRVRDRKSTRVTDLVVSYGLEIVEIRHRRKFGYIRRGTTPKDQN
jgi:hypothetical protein